MFIVLLEYVQPLSAVDAHIEEHRRFLDHHYAAGHFLASGPMVPRTGGAILVRHMDRAVLDDILAEDPFQREGIARYRVVEFSPNRFGAGVETVLLANPAVHADIATAPFS